MAETKRKPGRPRKTPLPVEEEVVEEEIAVEEPEEVVAEPAPENTPMFNKYGIRKGEQVPLHIANQIARDRDRDVRATAEVAAEAAHEAVETALTEMPRSGKRQLKDIRPPVETGEDE